jgi:hypothetical protein
LVGVSRHQRRFARPRRTHDGDVLALADLKRNAGAGIDRLIAHLVRLPKFFGPDDDSLPAKFFAAGRCGKFGYLCHS